MLLSRSNVYTLGLHAIRRLFDVSEVHAEYIVEITSARQVVQSELQSIATHLLSRRFARATASVGRSERGTLMMSNNSIGLCRTSLYVIIR